MNRPGLRSFSSALLPLTLALLLAVASSARAQTQGSAAFDTQCRQVQNLLHRLHPEEAYALLDRLSRTDRSGLEQGAQLRFLLLRAGMQRRAGHPQLAQRDAQEVLRLSPESASGVRARLELAEEGGTDDKTSTEWIAESQRLLARDPQLPRGLLEESQRCSGRVALAAGKWDAAWTCLASARGLAKSEGLRAEVAELELDLARAEAGVDLPREALRWQVQSQLDYRRIGDPYGEVRALRAQARNSLNEYATSRQLPTELRRRLQAFQIRAGLDPRLKTWVEVTQARLEDHLAGRKQAKARLEQLATQAATRSDRLEEAYASRSRALLSELDSNYAEALTWDIRAEAAARALNLHPQNPLFGMLNRVDMKAQLANYQDFTGHPLEALRGYRQAFQLAVETDQKPEGQLVFQLLRIQLLANDSTVFDTWKQCLRWIEQSRDAQHRAELYDLALYSAYSGSESSSDQVGVFRYSSLPEGSLAQRFLVKTLAEPAVEAFRKAREGSSKTRWYIAEALADRLLGRGAESVSAYRLAFDSAASGDDPGYLFIVAQDLAMELEHEGRAEEARDCLLRALPKARAPFGPPRVRMFLADWYRLHGQPAEALRVADQFLADHQALQYDEVASVLRIKAEALADLHHPAAALAILDEVGQQLRKRSENYQLASLLAQQARVQLALGQRDVALKSWDEALLRQPETVGLALPARLALPPMRELRAADPARAARIGQDCLSRVLDDPAHLYRPPVPGSAAERPVRELLDLTVSCLLESHQPARASALLESYRAWQTRPELDLSRAGPAGAALQAREQELRLLGTSQKAAPAREQARQGLLAALNTLRQQNPELEALLPSASPELAHLQEHLPADTLLLQFYPGEEELFILAQRSSGLQVYSVPVPRALLRQQVTAWREALTNSSAAPPEALRSQLFGWLLQPVAGIEQARKVLVLPTDCLWYLPWDSLEPAGRRDWCELTSPDLAQLESPPVRAGGHCLVLGPSAGAGLPAAEQEARDIAGLMPSQLLQGSEASRQHLEEFSPAATILHFCTHGRVESGDLNESLLSLADGPLSLQDVYGLRLPQGALVVLSACSTGLGEKLPGRSVTSLASAFRAAGASTVVSTLWPVADESTRKLMLTFYTGIKSGLSRGEALRQAKLALSQTAGCSHPYFWAGFNLSGDPR